jgi:predicted kinase
VTVVVLTGASGSGKTTLAAAVALKAAGRFDVLHFDAIGVPPHDEMIAVHGSPEAWQRAATFHWMTRLAAIAEDGRSVLLEGQMRLSFLAEAAAAAGISYAPVLVDCNDETRAMRLSVDRAQPELASPDMMNWAAYLRREASEAGCLVLETSGRDVDSCADFVVELLALPKSPDGDWDAQRP